MNTIERIKNNDTYKQVLADSFGGVMYNVANQDKYNAAEIVELWESMSDGEKAAAGGIMKGAINFVQGK